MKKPTVKPAPLCLTVYEGQDPVTEEARVKSGPLLPSATVITRFAKPGLGEVDINGAMTALKDAAEKASAGDMSDVEATLVAQAAALNVMFSELSRRACENMGAGYLDASSQYLKLALRAQDQSRRTLETLANVKNPPVVFAKQANIAHGHQQVNNGVTVPGSRAGEIENSPNRLLGDDHGERLDAGTASTASGGHKALAALDTINRPEDGCR